MSQHARRKLPENDSEVIVRRGKQYSLVGSTLLCLLATAALSAPGRSASSLLAVRPPLGWNSWDAYGTTVTEADVRANAAWMAEKLKPFGWQYVTVDEGWFVSNPTAHGDDETAHRTLDANGRYIPAVNRFPSSAGGQGFTPMAAYVHSLGLRFGIHILQGIPREAVRENLPIAGSTARASAAANPAGICSWNPDNYDLKPTAEGQAYYDSIARLYAQWGVDLIKIDCIASRPYKGDEIRMFRAALAKTGRPIVLSLSPGEPPHDKTPELQRYAQMWRISDDTWDLWAGTGKFPQGINDQFARLSQWITAASTGHWPDADMLPLGYLGPSPGYGQARMSRLTHDEQRTLFTLWSIFRSPLIMGGNLTRTDSWTLALLTNPEVLAVDQESVRNRSVMLTDETAVWAAETPDRNHVYLAIFNRTDQPAKMHCNWNDLGLPAHSYRARELWDHRDLGVKQSCDVVLASHASTLLRLSAVQ